MTVVSSLRHPELVEGSVQAHLPLSKLVMRIAIRWFAWSTPYFIGLMALAYFVGWQGPLFWIFILTPWLWVTIMLVVLGFRKWRVALTLLIFGVGWAAYPALCDLVAPMKLQRAKNYVSSVVPLLEQYRQIHGAYPEKLGALNDNPQAPFFLQYHKNQDGYNFSFPSWGDAVSIDIYVYECRSSSWRVENCSWEVEN